MTEHPHPPGKRISTIHFRLIDNKSLVHPLKLALVNNEMHFFNNKDILK